MKQVTAQQFANIFGVYVAKINTGRVFACEKKFNKSHGTWLSVYPYSTIDITPLVSDASSLNWNKLIEPQEEFLTLGDNKCTRPKTECHAQRQDGICMNGIICKPAEPLPVPFDENYAPEGYKAVKHSENFYLQHSKIKLDTLRVIPYNQTHGK